MNLRQKAVKGVVWSAIQSWGSQTITFLIFLILARLLEPKDYGLVASAGVFISFMYMLQDQGFSQAIIQRRDLEPEHLDTAFWTSVGIGVVITVSCIAAAEPVAGFFHQPQLVPILRWLSLNFLLTSFNGVQQALLSRRLGFKNLAMRTLLATFISGTVGVVIAFRGFGVWSLVAQQLTRQLVGVLVLWHVSDWRPGFNVSKKHFKDLFGFGIHFQGSSLLNFLNTRSGDFLIGYFLGPIVLGYYSIAYRLPVMMLQILNSTRNQVTLPAFSQLQQDPERLRRAFYTVTQFTSLLSFPAFFGLAVLAPELVRGLFGNQWEPSIPVLQVLAFNGLIQSVQGFNGNVITALGKPGENLKVTFLNSMANIVGFAIAVHWGIVAVAVSYLTCSYLFSPLRFWLVRKLAGVELIPYLRQYVAPLIGSIVMSVAILGSKHFFSGLVSVPVLLAVCVLVGTTTYTLVLLLIAPSLFQRVLDLARSVVPVGKKRNA